MQYTVFKFHGISNSYVTQYCILKMTLSKSKYVELNYTLPVQFIHSENKYILPGIIRPLGAAFSAGRIKGDG